MQSAAPPPPPHPPPPHPHPHPRRLPCPALPSPTPRTLVFFASAATHVQRLTVHRLQHILTVPRGAATLQRVGAAKQQGGDSNGCRVWRVGSKQATGHTGLLGSTMQARPARLATTQRSPPSPSLTQCQA